MSQLSVGEIHFFSEYVFTDDGTTAPHTAMVLLPRHWNYEESTHFCVVTSSARARGFVVKIPKLKYSFLKNDSTICLERADLQRIDGSTSWGRIDSADLKKCKKCIHGCIAKQIPPYDDRFFTAAVIREWKKAITNNQPAS